MRHIAGFAMVFAVILTMPACKEKPPALEIFKARSNVMDAEAGYNFSKAVTTVGNHHFLPLPPFEECMEEDSNRVTASSVIHAKEILSVVDAFERAHPEWEIEWRLDARLRSFNTCSAVFGIWIDHRPRTTSMGMGFDTGADLNARRQAKKK
jgi:hypothetical protein